MVAIALGRSTQKSGLRPLDPTRDLQQVADLIQTAFAADLDQSGEAMLRDMRQMSRLGPLLWWFEQPGTGVGQMMSGFVWVERDRIVGNVTTTPVSVLGSRWVISNVAVAPAYRGRGIARHLMEAALEMINDQGGKVVTLQVRDDNSPALHIYRDMGFKHVFGTTYLRLDAINYSRRYPMEVVGLRPRQYNAQEAYRAYRLAREATPEEVQAEYAVSLYQYRLGWKTMLMDHIRALLEAAPPLRLVAEQGDRLVATVTALPRQQQTAGQMTLMVHPDARGELETGLVVTAMNHMVHHRTKTVRIQHPTYHQEGIRACQSLGFRHEKTLVWMRKPL
jgi:ribosomal protein S18 acetylase RimI-like enzyme